VRARGSIGTFLFLVSIACCASADDYDATVARAAEARDRALESQSAEDWRQALALFAAAVALRPTMEAKFEYAEAAARLGLDDVARAAYQAAIDLGLEGKAAERARRFVEEHQARSDADPPKQGPESGLVPSVALTVPPAAPAPPVRRAPPAEEPAATPGWQLPVLLSGGGLVTVGAVTIVVTSIRLGDARDELARECAVVENDECVATTAGRLSRAQTIGNDILALKGVRWAGIGAAVLGVGAVGVSLVSLLGREDSAQSSTSLVLEPSAASILWRGAF
jgi:hypothetical protein